MVVPSSFDAEYVRQQLGGLHDLDREAMFKRYREHEDPPLNPHRAFDAEWYRWQNPDAASHPSLLDHYLAVSGERAVDPAPWIDTTLLKRQFESPPSPVDLLDLALLPGWSAEHGVTAGPGDLARKQRDFLGAIEFSAVRPPRDPPERKSRLLWVQHGPGSRFLDWFDASAPRSWDLAMNWYTGDPDPELGECVLRQSGTKFTGIFSAAARLPGFFDGYAQVLFIDDDLGFAFGDIDRIFDIAEDGELDLFQASVAEGSFCVWPDLFHRPGRQTRPMTAVEIMAPGFSAWALTQMISCFSLSVSGFGLDLLAGKLVRMQSGRVAVVDAVQMQHQSRIDQAEGAYYELLRRNGINSKYELWCLMRRYGLTAEFREDTGGVA